MSKCNECNGKGYIELLNRRVPCDMCTPQPLSEPPPTLKIKSSKFQLVSGGAGGGVTIATVWTIGVFIDVLVAAAASYRLKVEGIGFDLPDRCVVHWSNGYTHSVELRAAELDPSMPMKLAHQAATASPLATALSTPLAKLPRP